MTNDTGKLQLKVQQRFKLVEYLNKVVWERLPTTVLAAIVMLVSERLALIQKEKEMGVNGEKG